MPLETDRALPPSPLSPDERARAARFRLGRDRRRFVQTRTALRLLLGRCLDLPPAAIRFARGPHGKPALAGSTLRFNVSHAAEWAVCALSCDRAVGVDVEAVGPNALDLESVHRLLLPSERDELAAADPADRIAPLLSLWTRKEAVAKALGIGLHARLGSIELTASDEHRTTERIRVDGAREQSWGVKPFAPAPGYVAAVAARGHDWHLVRRDFRWEQF